MSAKLDQYPAAMTLADFLTWERQQPDRYAFVDGEVWMMTGGTANHNRLVRNVANGLNSALGRRGCEAFTESMKVIAAECCFYPDIVLTCRPVPGDADTIETPSLVVEVLSPSTARVDRLRKWESYQTLPSLEACLMVPRDRVRVDLYVRHEGGWMYNAVTDRDAVIEISALGLSLPLSEIYRNVSFEPSAPAPP